MLLAGFAPTFSKYPLQPNQFATEGANTTLMCRPEAAPYPLYEDITWYKDGAPLNPEGDRVLKMPNGNLYISQVNFGDSGVYMCHVFNLHGEASTTGNLTVLSKHTNHITMPVTTCNINTNINHWQPDRPQ